MACDKVTYETEGLAKNAAIGQQKAKTNKENWKEYLCRHCNKWHLTSGRKKTLKGAPRKRNSKKFQALKLKFRKMKRK